MSLPTQVIHLAFPKQLLAEIDMAIPSLYINRSEFIRQATVEKLRQLTAPHAKPNGFDIYMTDVQLDEMFEITRLERLRRKRKGLA